MTQERTLVERLERAAAFIDGEVTKPFHQWATRKVVENLADAASSVREAIVALSAPAGVGVKKLHWEHVPRGTYVGITYCAKTILGDYLAQKGRAYFDNCLIEAEGPTLEDGKAAAQADFERRILSSLSTMPGEAVATLQERVQPWMMACFGPEIAADKLERSDRFMEEALELVQAGGYPKERVFALVEYVYGRPQGDINQEVGGVMITLAAHCLAHGVDMHAAGEAELARIWTKVDAIRAKQAAKPTGSALPITAPAQHDGWRPGDLVYWDGPIGKVNGQFVQMVEGWPELAFADGSTAICRPSRVMPRKPLPASPLKGGEGNG